MQHQPVHESASILHELNLGHHILFMLRNGSIDLFAYDEQLPALAESGIRLDSDETYRLFISLREQFQPGRDGSSSTGEKGQPSSQPPMDGPGCPPQAPDNTQPFFCTRHTSTERTFAP
jgi:hypothetical protein